MLSGKLGLYANNWGRGGFLLCDQAFKAMKLRLRLQKPSGYILIDRFIKVDLEVTSCMMGGKNRVRTNTYPREIGHPKPIQESESGSHRPKPRKFISYLRLCRAPNLILVFLSVMVGGFMGGLSPLWRTLIAGLSASLVAGGGNVLDDIFDLRIDRMNRPFRPLPSGEIKPKEALSLTFLLLLGLGLSPLLGLRAVFLALLSSFLLLSYPLWWRRRGLMGNLVVSLLGGVAFLYGGVAVGRPKAALIPALFALLYHLGRELLKDIEDREGDRAGGKTTYPLMHGLNASLRLVTLSFGLLICLTFLPFLLNIYHLPYLLTVGLGVDSFLLFLLCYLWRKKEASNWSRVTRLLKLNMPLGLLAICLGRI